MPAESVPPKRFPPYTRYASVYDEIGQRAFGERIAEATLDYLRETGRTPTRVIDLACGTGAATSVFAAAGMATTGVDRSPQMLAAAAAAFDRAGLAGTWIEADIRDVATAERFQLATCFYDSINYLLEPEDLAAAFRSAFCLLEPGGFLIFDVNTREKFDAAWNDACYVAVDRDELFGVYQSWFEPETGRSPLRMTFFVAGADGHWTRFDEEHVERAYPLDDIEALVHEAGFGVVTILDYRDHAPRFGPPATARSYRAVFIATRPDDHKQGADEQ